jgi:hypothetical protein
MEGWYVVGVIVGLSGIDAVVVDETTWSNVGVLLSVVDETSCEDWPTVGEFFAEVDEWEGRGVDGLKVVIVGEDVVAAAIEVGGSYEVVELGGM